MKKLTEMQKAIRVVDATMGLIGGPGSAQEHAWAIVKRAAELSEGPQPAPNTAMLKLLCDIKSIASTNNFLLSDQLSICDKVNEGIALLQQ